MTARGDQGYSHERYVEVIKRMWTHPLNDQRPAVRRWLIQNCAPASIDCDIGCGDAYYLDLIRPKIYYGIDPNEHLLAECRAALAHNNVPARLYDTIHAALRSINGVACDYLLLLHSMLYLSKAELMLALRDLKWRHCIIVHPWLPASSTVAFEESIGVEVAAELVREKQKLLGPPSRFEIVKSHLWFDFDVSNADLAFVVAHRALPFVRKRRAMAEALKLVRQKRSEWGISGAIAIPQWQAMEVYDREL